MPSGKKKKRHKMSSFPLQSQAFNLLFSADPAACVPLFRVSGGAL